MPVIDKIINPRVTRSIRVTPNVPKSLPEGKSTITLSYVIVLLILLSSIIFLGSGLPSLGSCLHSLGSQCGLSQ